MMICAISTMPCAFSNAEQVLTGRLPSAMFTPVIRSDMFTTPEPLQSPTHAGVAVGDALAVPVAVGVLVGVEEAVEVLVAVSVVAGVAVVVGVAVAELVGVAV